MHLRKLLDWKTALIYVHRWTGIVLGLVFVVWFVSGVAMMYVGMPRLSVAERLGHLPPLNLSIARVSPAEAAERHQLLGRQLKIEMYFDGRPIYRIDGTNEGVRGHWRPRTGSDSPGSTLGAAVTRRR